ncbi:hypothetical protein BH11PSE11_BH11PSE11_18220 [soil metagenome]
MPLVSALSTPCGPMTRVPSSGESSDADDIEKLAAFHTECSTELNTGPGDIPGPHQKKALHSVKSIKNMIVEQAAALFNSVRHIPWSKPRGEDELPLRAELYGAIQMEQHGAILAASHKLSSDWNRDRLLLRLADNEEVLLNTCNLLTQAVKDARRIKHPAEWLLENFYLIEE